MILALDYPTHEAPGDSRRNVGLWYRWLARLLASILAVPVFPRASRRTSAVDRTLTRANPDDSRPAAALGDGKAAARSETAWTIAHGSRTTPLPEAASILASDRPTPLTTPSPYHRAPGVESPLDGTMVATDETRNPDQRGPAGNPGRDSGGRPVR